MPHDNLTTREKRMPSIRKDVHPDRTDLPEDAVTVPPRDGHEHGYIGAVADSTSNHEFTVAGVTAAAEKVAGPAARSAGRSSSKGADQ